MGSLPAISCTIFTFDLDLSYMTGINEDNAVAGEHDCHSLMSTVLFLLKMGLVEIRIFNRMQSP